MEPLASAIWLVYLMALLFHGVQIIKERHELANIWSKRD